MRNFVISDDLAAMRIDGYLHVKTANQLLQYNGVKLLVEDESVLIFGDIRSANATWLSQLPFMTEPELFQNLYNICGAFLLIFYYLDTSETKVVSDRTGHYKLFFSAVDQSFQLSDDLTKFHPGKVSKAALSEYIHYRWNNTQSSYFENVKQIFHGEYVTIRDNKIIKRQKYNNVFWGDVYLPPVSNKDLKLALLNALQRSINPELPTYVLLSGGVDSALLLALTKQLVPDVIAITPNHHQHANSELDRAIKFARVMDVPHKILDIDDNEIRQLFQQATWCIQQAPRHQSTVTLFRTLNSISTPANIIYGEAADNLFGSGTVRNFRARQRKIKQKSQLPAPLKQLFATLLPKSNKLRLLLQDSVLSNFLSYNKINNPSSMTKLLPVADYQLIEQDFFRRYSLKKANLEQLSVAQLVLFFKQWVFDTYTVNHMFETGQVCAHFKHNLVTPFLDATVLSFAKQLTDDEYYGGSHVKPLLRELGAQYYPKEWMYLPKLGFPVPHESWVDNELKEWVVAARRQFGVEDLPVDVELSWTLAGLYLLQSHWPGETELIQT